MDEITESTESTKSSESTQSTESTESTKSTESTDVTESTVASICILGTDIAPEYGEKIKDYIKTKPFFMFSMCVSSAGLLWAICRAETVLVLLTW